jgi:hypothetical protein
MSTEIVHIDRLYMDYNLTDVERELLTDIVGEVPFPAYKDPLAELARKFLAGEDLTDTARFRYLSAIGDTKLLNQDVKSFSGLVGLEAEELWPITCKMTPLIQFGAPIEWQVTATDGGHRIAYAIAKGWERMRATFRAPLVIEEEFIYGHDRPYQTLIFPTGKVDGMRKNERWELLRPEDIVGKRILDLGCSSGVDGILSVLCGAKDYYGIDLHPPSIGYGWEMVRAWGVEEKVTLAAGNVGIALIPRVDTVFLFSVAQRIPLGALVRAIDLARPDTIYVESHAREDATAADLMHRLDYHWGSLGAVPQSILSPRWRMVYRGRK